ncbi:hypothetical protein DFJ58DRAFT_841210 [Suillus subalutaceus]|uniref:uncharacterized protein n=1 Tax=Suillus subalutaceus TaxID=48586 RepID=UPI001B87DE45|nr:uncharacterized protein DFJ58DRAFT_841210 [Suillus subalutaceus]KAG1855201.1 hypothetical protein DFJ58DRAFT_841210 [Suillus subalutaceus]
MFTEMTLILETGRLIFLWKHQQEIFRAMFLVAKSGLDIYAYNGETVEELTPFVCDCRATFRQSLKDFTRLMSNLDVVTFGQYMRPTKRNMKVERYVESSEFD